MFGLIVLALLLIWLFASIGFARWIGRRVPQQRIRFVLTVLLAPIFFVLPLADEIIGKLQFDRLCEDAREIKIHGTIPMGEELYSSGGEWRRSDRDIPLHEAQRIDRVTEGLVRYDNGKPTVVPGWIPMLAYETKIFDRRDGRLLASYKFFSTSGGWISRRLEKPLVVRDQCFPEDSNQYQKKIFPFDSSKESNKP
jgi:hypothetical protein